MWPSERLLKFGPDVPAHRLISAQAHAGLNDDELEWKLASSDASDPYGLAKRERERAEGDYDRLMWEQSKLEAMARLGSDPAAERALGDLRDAANRSLEARRAWVAHGGCRRQRAWSGLP